MTDACLAERPQQPTYTDIALTKHTERAKVFFVSLFSRTDIVAALVQFTSETTGPASTYLPCLQRPLFVVYLLVDHSLAVSSTIFAYPTPVHTLVRCFLFVVIQFDSYDDSIRQLSSSELFKLVSACHRLWQPSVYS